LDAFIVCYTRIPASRNALASKTNVKAAMLVLMPGKKAALHAQRLNGALIYYCVRELVGMLDFSTGFAAVG
jgi:hypothetical protein